MAVSLRLTGPAPTEAQVEAIGTDTARTALIRAALGSAAQRAIIPMYDWLGLGAEAHLNTPGRLGGNWAWRAAEGFETGALAQTILTECSVCCRTGQDLLLRALPKGWSAQDAAKAEKPAAKPADKAAARA